jgi:putative DNA primase/helicase
MTDGRDPFAPIDDSAVLEPTAKPNNEPQECVVTPVPQNAERVGEAASRLMGRQPDDFWRYHNANGELLFVVVRWNLPDGKKILPMSWVRDADGSENWKFRAHPIPRPLYRLGDLEKSPDASVAIVEGEKCAEAARKVFPDFIVTTSSGGAKAVAHADWTSLKQRNEVLVWGDADEAGNAYAERVAFMLHRLSVPNIRVVDNVALASRTPDGGTREPPLGWDVAKALEEGWTVEALRLAVEQNARPWTPRAPRTEWSDDFEMTAKGLAKIERKEDDSETYLFTGPFTVIGEGRDHGGAGRGLWISWLDRDDRAQRGFVRHADLVGDGVEWLKELTDRGFPGPIERKKINWLRQALHGCRPADRITMVRRTGWFGTVFVLPHKTIGNREGEHVMFDGRTDIARYAESGTLEQWSKEVAAPAAGNSRLMFSESVGFAGPVADLLDEGSFGFHLDGGSSIGKTAALVAAGSAWGGGGPLGFAYSWRTTDNGAEGMFSAHSGTMVPLDELSQLATEVASTLTYMFGNGHGKSRAGRNGEARRTAEWRGLLLSTGEVGIAAKIEEFGRCRKAKAGQLVRLIDIPADAGSGHGLFETCHGEPAAEFARRLKASATSCYGSAGPAFVAHLAELLAADSASTKSRLRERVDTVQKELVQGMNAAEGQVTRVARYFAVVAVAGDLARAALNLPWNDGEPISAARKCFEAWMTKRGGSDPQEILTAITALREVIEVHGPARFQYLNGVCDDAIEGMNNHPVRDQLGYRFTFQGETVWGFTTTGIKEVLRGIGDAATLVAELADRGVIRRGAERLQVEKKVGGAKRRLYAVPDSSLFAIE